MIWSDGLKNTRNSSKNIDQWKEMINNLIFNFFSKLYYAVNELQQYEIQNKNNFYEPVLILKNYY